jgi:hypothetical protein
MDPTAFDTLTRALSNAGSRRRLLVWLTELLPAGVGMLLGEAAAARGRQHGLNRGHHPGKAKDNRKGQRKGQGRGGPACGINHTLCKVNGDCCSGNCVPVRGERYGSCQSAPDQGT